MEDKKDILESLAGVAQLKHDNVIKDDRVSSSLFLKTSWKHPC